jgi:site-specific DNA-methyltransferase (adenine-specific)
LVEEKRRGRMIDPYYDHKGITIYHGDCLEIMPELEPVDAIITDPPYNGVVVDDWDNEWLNDKEFFTFIDSLMVEFKRSLLANGSLYMFSWPRLSCQTEYLINTHFTVLNHIVWNKKGKTGGGSGIDITALRKFWFSSERIIFAEQQGSDKTINGRVGYSDKCNEAARDVFGVYIKKIRKENKLSSKDLTEVIGAYGKINHGGACSNWEKGYNVPTEEHYNKIKNAWSGYFIRKYEDLRKEYEDLRKEYEDLRRPFNLNKSMQWGDVWEFAPPSKRNGHPCEKPINLMKHIIGISTKSTDTILDPFMGSGTTLVAAKELGRKAIGIEIEEKYAEIAAQRLSQEVFSFD